MIDPEIAMQLYDPASKNHGEHYPRYAKVPIEINYIKGGKKVYYQVIDPMFKRRIGLDVVKSLMKEGRAHFVDEPTQGMGELYADPASKKRKGSSWLDFVKAHKDMRTAKGLLDLKAISELWKAEKALDPASIRVKTRSEGITPTMRILRGTPIWQRKRQKLPYFTKEQKEERRKWRTYDPKPPKNWFAAMFQGIKKGSDVRNPAAIVSSIWKRLSPSKRASIKAREAKGEHFKYDLPLPHDLSTKGTGTLRMVKPFKLAEVQVNLSVKDYLAALKSGLFSRMKRGDGSTALVKRCKSDTGNCNIFIDKSGGK